MITNFVTIYTDTLHKEIYMNKICRICSQEKSIKLFYKRHLNCIQCWNEKRRSERDKSICRYCNVAFRPNVKGRYKYCSDKCRFNAKIKIDTISGCWLWQAAINNKGYGTFVLNGWGKCSLAHRVSLYLFKGNIENNLDVLHNCDNTRCVNPDHLWLGSHQDNMNDMLSKGRDNRARIGEDNPSVKLTESDILKIRELAEKKYQFTELAKLFNVSLTNISSIVKKKIWKHI